MTVSLPRCPSWFGHRFEARYDDVASSQPPPDFNKNPELAVFAADLLPLFRNHIYVLDVCVRCGAVVGREEKEGA
jgi:hypothetical protein